MIHTDKEFLDKCSPEYRLWQGIPSVEVTHKGRVFASFYSGAVGERIGNYALVVKSDDDGKTFSEPVVAAYLEDHRCFDPCLWLDPLGRLWFTWAIMPNDGTYASICENPDSDILEWSEAFFVGKNIMMNKPTVLSSGEWLFPIAVWLESMRAIYKIPFEETVKPGAYVYKTVDNGKTFERLGGADVPRRDFDEHVILELTDGRLANYVRTDYGVGVSYSYDRGKTWSKGVDSRLGGAESRFQIRRLRSGRILMINHIDTRKRTNLAACLSEDEGKTWKYKLMLDDREWVSYPDFAEGEDGTIYVIYDRERGGTSLETTYAKAREILLARITEEDIIAGELIDSKSYLRHVVSKLGKYAREDENPYGEFERYSTKELAEILIRDYPDEITSKLFDIYAIDCVNVKRLDNVKIDAIAGKIENGEKTQELVSELITMMRAGVGDSVKESMLVEDIKNIILKSENDISVSDIAAKLSYSVHYMMHHFKKITGITINNYKNEIRMTKAKKLLIESDISITDIAQMCGFCSSSYFSEAFMNSEKVSPSEYRKLLKIN